MMRPSPAPPGRPPEALRLKRSFWFAPSIVKLLYRLYWPPAVGPPVAGTLTCGVSLTRSVRLRLIVGMRRMSESVTSVDTPWCDGLNVDAFALPLNRDGAERHRRLRELQVDTRRRREGDGDAIALRRLVADALDAHRVRSADLEALHVVVAVRAGHRAAAIARSNGW